EARPAARRSVPGRRGGFRAGRGLVLAEGLRAALRRPAGVPPGPLLARAPLALAVVVARRRRGGALPLLGGWIAVTAVFYSVYESTPQHPRFLFVVLPALFVLEAAGALLPLRRAGIVTS